MTVLRKVADNVWEASAPLRLAGLRLGTRMTIVRMRDGGLWLHSVIPLSHSLSQEIDALGPVKHIVAPNLFHHLYANEVKQVYPNALLHAPRALGKKRKDLKIDVELSDSNVAAFEADFEQITIPGTLMQETVFYHKSTRTLIASDLVENFQECSHWWTRIYLKLAGVWRQAGWSRFLRFMYRDRKLARSAIDRILTWPFERVIVAHGEIMTQNARDSVRSGLAWLQGPQGTK